MDGIVLIWYDVDKGSDKMQNIPVFTTTNGVGSLILREIPYDKTAYIKIESSQEPKAFLDECVDFCKTVGAEFIFASGHEVCCKYPFHTAIWRMSRDREGLPDTDACLIPVTERTVNHWLEIYNKKMEHVANSSYMNFFDGKKLITKGTGYFVHVKDKLLGIGVANWETIEVVASLQPGAGREIVLALNHALFGERVVLEVASTNEKAVKLYESLGFIKTAELSRWYKIF